MGISIGSSTNVRAGETPPPRPPRPARRPDDDLEPHPPGDVLLPVLEAREILPRELALSEARRPLEERDVDRGDSLRPRTLRHLLRHHLADDRDRNPRQTVDDLLRAGDARAG